MISENKKSGGLATKEARSKKLAYTPEFRAELFANPGVIKTFLELEKRMLHERKKTLTNVEMTLEDVKKGETASADYYKVSIGGRYYFVKKVYQYFKGGGFGEIMSAKTATDILKQNNIDWAEVVDFKLGYEKDGIRYFVSVWDERLKTELVEYIGQMDQTNPEEAARLRTRYDLLQKALSDFWDLYATNMSYDPVSDKIILYDLYERKYLKK